MRLVDQIADQLQTLIREQGLKPGERLTAERKLAEELGVSRPSLREAIQKLASKGLLVSRRGGGTYLQAPPAAPTAAWSENSLVTPLATLFVDDPEYRYDVLEARHAIEGACAWHAALRATDEDKVRVRDAFEATLQFNESENPDLAAQADARFHLAVAEASHNLVLMQTMRGLFDLLQSTVTRNRKEIYTVPHNFAQLTGQHRALMRAVLDGDANAARDAVTSHLDFVRTTVRTLDEDDARRARAMRLFTPS
jgi:GntR family transcriptional regulator, L-lactate dehydrogenase operon regulator